MEERRDRKRRARDMALQTALGTQTARMKTDSFESSCNCTPLTYIITVHQRTLPAIHLKALMSLILKSLVTIYTAMFYF